MNIFQLIATLRQSLPSAAVRVEQGHYQVVSVSYNSAGQSSVTELSPWVPGDCLESTITRLTN